MCNEEEDECKDKEKHYKREAKGKQVEKLNNEGYKRCLGGKGN